MKRATLYPSIEEMRSGPCPTCGIPNGDHTPPAALECWREMIRHPDADADDALWAVAGAVFGLTAVPPSLAAAAARRLYDELESALVDRGCAPPDAETRGGGFS